MKLSLANLSEAFVKVPGQKFQVCKYPVTQQLWREIAEKYPESGLPVDPSYFKGPNRPVECITAEQMKIFVKYLNIDQEQTGDVYMIPTSDQWEVAAKGGTESKGFTYAGSNNLDEVGWYYENSGEQTHDVGEKLPNEIGAYEMSGNVWETTWENEEDFMTVLKEVAKPNLVEKIKRLLFG